MGKRISTLNASLQKEIQLAEGKPYVDTDDVGLYPQLLHLPISSFLPRISAVRPVHLTLPLGSRRPSCFQASSEAASLGGLHVQLYPGRTFWRLLQDSSGRPPRGFGSPGFRLPRGAG